MKALNLLAFIALALGGSGCFNPINPYNPEIPPNSFTCSSLCPEGLRCVDGLCVSEVIDPDGRIFADAGPDPDGAPEKGRVYMDASIPRDAAGCGDESEEPNNSSATATVLGATMTISGLAICYPGDVDHLSYRVQQGTTLRVMVQFTHADGDLDAVLLDPEGQTIDESKGFSDGEVLEMAAGAAQTDRYVIGVAGYDGAVNTYSLLIDTL